MFSRILSIPDKIQTKRQVRKEWTVVTVMAEVAAQTEMTQMVEYGRMAHRLIRFYFSTCAVFLRVSEHSAISAISPEDYTCFNQTW